MPPQEKITGEHFIMINVASPMSFSVADGVHYREILSLCLRLEEHLSEAAKVVGTEQVST